MIDTVLVRGFSGPAAQIRNPQPAALHIHGSVRIEQNGTVHLEHGVSLDEASATFWQRIGDAFPALFTPREALTKAEERIKELEAGLEKIIHLGQMHPGFSHATRKRIYQIAKDTRQGRAAT